ncbi:mitogen-activated protein kinase 15 isoform X1 [Callithrix jacchus]|uniref:mitogen-activated protein kinase 15 isoform X3 n=1 Tax=Callithrix jacchus TaxID=9483 RepID=UPI00159EB396|nr:mitogen-activated protein kinase 15 isoform X3 [Callithrix jacchus]
MCAPVDPRVARRYLLRRRLGKGAYGIVWKAVDRRTGEVVAIKKIFDAFRDKTDAQTPVFLSLQRTFREITLLQEFGEHPNIISLLDVIRAQNDRDIYLVFECMETDLNAVIRKGGLLQDVHVRCIFSQLLRATRFLHSGHIVHRDQKPSNVLLDANCTVKLCDFGLARSLRDLPEGPEGQALTEYVATRWYRAPEVLLSSHRYTLGVDMWSLGCILAEMLRGKPLFPGTSTLHQLELILETIPPPSEEDLLALGSGCRASVLHHLGSRQHTAAHRPRRTLDALLPPDTSPEALDLLRRLLVFAPDKRLSATQALQHPYLQRFHCSSDEWARKEDVQLQVHEGLQLSVPEYRSRVYQMILERGGSNCTSREKGLEGVTPGVEPRASPSQAHLCKPRANPQLSSGTPVQGPRPRPQSGLGHDPPEHECPRVAKNIPRQSSTPLLQAAPLGRGERPPGAKAEPPLTLSLVKPSERGAASSLTSQSVAQVANQALIRGDRNRGGGVSMAPGCPLPHPPFPLLFAPFPILSIAPPLSSSHPLRSSRPPLRCTPSDTSPYVTLDCMQVPPRPGRRMFCTSASQGAQGAARALLGGYSQAYGTVCHSALGHLPLLEGHRV